MNETVQKTEPDPVFALKEQGLKGVVYIPERSPPQKDLEFHGK
jgi:hypothetical protein